MSKASLKKDMKEYLAATASALKATDNAALADIADCLVQAKERGATVYTAGNGGSAATASHMVNDLIKGCRVHGREGFRAVCLNDAGAVVTCLANDYSYDDAYAIALRTLAVRGDVLVVFSGSGNSPSVVNAARQARDSGVTVIGFLGRDGGVLKELCSFSVIAPDACMERIEDLHMAYEHALVTAIKTELADRWGMEIIAYPGEGRVFKSALFDFDGTLSLIREGWQDIMTPYFTELLTDTPKGKKEDPKELGRIARELIDRLTGKQTIFQCIEIGKEVEKRGGKAEDPMVYKTEYLRRLMEKIHDKREGLANGTIKPKELLVRGSIELLRALKNAGIQIYLASGTDEPQVKEEAALLGVDEFFGEHIYGALDEHVTSDTKAIVIRRIMDENGFDGSELLSFGDGFVEIELVANIGGYAFAVATDEARGYGIDIWKRDRLVGAGASAVIPEFSGYKKIIDFIKGK